MVVILVSYILIFYYILLSSCDQKLVIELHDYLPQFYLNDRDVIAILLRLRTDCFKRGKEMEGSSWVFWHLRSLLNPTAKDLLDVDLWIDFPGSTPTSTKTDRCRRSILAVY